MIRHIVQVLLTMGCAGSVQADNEAKRRDDDGKAAEAAGPQPAPLATPPPGKQRSGSGSAVKVLIRTQRTRSGGSSVRLRKTA